MVDNKTDNSGDIQKPWLFQPGVSGNPKGKPKGTFSLKTYAKKMLKEMSDKEKLEFMRGLPKEVLWKMAEGNPAQDVTTGGEKINVQPILGGFTRNVQTDDSDKEIKSTTPAN